MKYILFLAIFSLGSVLPCNSGYCSFEKIVPEKDSITSQKSLITTPIPKYTQKPKLVGKYGSEWDATLKSVNGIVISVQEETPDFAYAPDLGKPFYLAMVLGNWIASDTFFVPHYPHTRKVEITFVDPNWALIDANQVQSVMNNSQVSQSYTYFPIPQDLKGFNIKKVGIKAIIQIKNHQIRVLKIEKVYYE